MTFQPVVVGAGLVGWRFLQNTLDSQKTAFANSAELTRTQDYFSSRIGSISDASDLVADRRLLEVGLTAYGLETDLDNRFFVQKILEDGTLNTDALANRLADDRYAEFSRAFGFGDFSVPRTQLSDFPSEILGRFTAQRFEAAVGTSREDMRLALNFDRILPELTSGTAVNDTLWFRVMGNPPVRSVFETALSLPQGFGKLDIDQQLEIFKSRSLSRFGTDDLRALSSDPTREKVIETFLLQDQIRSFSNSTTNAALVLVQNAALLQKSFAI